MINKVFVIGANKTGTTSMKEILLGLGFNVPNTQQQELVIVDAMYKGRFEEVKTFINQYDAFKDMPFSAENFYIVADVLFPNSKFILTIRARNVWFKSLLNFHKKVFGFKYARQANEQFFKNKNIYLEENYAYNNLKRLLLVFNEDLNQAGGVNFAWNKSYSKRFRIARYSKRNEEIVRYFSSRLEQLLIIDITKEVDTSKIISFLNLPDDLVSDIPHINKT
jgi:hypothetical protein